MALAILSAFVGSYGSAFLSRNPRYVPEVPQARRSVEAARKSKVISGAAPLYSALGPHRRLVGLLGLDATVSVLGYCIATPEPEAPAAVLDERWLLLPQHLMVAAWRVGEALPASRQPAPCPGARALGGPQKIVLQQSDVRGDRLILRATAPGASTIGFAIFVHRWRTAAVERAARSGMAMAVVPGRGSFVILAVACWADELPAHPKGAILASFATFGHPSSRVTRPALEAETLGAKRACESATYGAPTSPPGRRRRVTYVPSVSQRAVAPPLLTTETARVQSTAPAPLGGGSTSTRQSGTSSAGSGQSGSGQSSSSGSAGSAGSAGSSKSSSSGARLHESRETVGPEQIQNSDHEH